ncbi:MAM domain-containing glycosylphosphatidylinositol anchor protein 2 [Chelonia mydas]|uniref:MAM domain-containing glycosylphosphatidylinositol anchor protein 2 n=1 Tax=Chelonia mydas TaxID=8469 RepID=M7ATC6_CHEMY|nr:MAM domain-containing glycosylphosphatidylinositol anchor protein 2 [Chelonia mydas]
MQGAHNLNIQETTDGYRQMGEHKETGRRYCLLLWRVAPHTLPAAAIVDKAYDAMTSSFACSCAGQQRWWEQEITVNGNIQKGELITYNLTELIKPEAYEVRLTPITRFGEGDSTIRVIKYSAPVNPHLREFHCGFEDGNICLFTQDDTDNFDWTKQSTATRDTKYTPNTGPNADRSGSKEGFYMYIETSRPRLEGEKARLLSPFFSVAPKNPYGVTNTAYCFSFYYHMYGQHIGSLNVYLRLKGQTTIENPVWSSSGNKGQHWNQARVNIHPTTSFQLIFEGIRGPGIEGDIAIDDVSIVEGECMKADQPANRWDVNSVDEPLNSGAALAKDSNSVHSLQNTNGCLEDGDVLQHQTFIILSPMLLFAATQQDGENSFPSSEELHRRQTIGHFGPVSAPLPQVQQDPSVADGFTEIHLPRLTTGRRMKYNNWLLADKHLYNEAARGGKSLYAGDEPEVKLWFQTSPNPQTLGKFSYGSELCPSDPFFMKE